jgi:hypothetical protein
MQSISLFMTMLWQSTTQARFFAENAGPALACRLAVPRLNPYETGS